MLDEALGALETLLTTRDTPGAAAVFFEAGWHKGVVGILAARLRERLHRPIICFARADSGTTGNVNPANPGLLRGSGRSIPGFHLRDCLDLVAKRAPGLILRFGGHAQAAGLTLREADLARFADLFERTAAELMPPGALAPIVETDGALDGAYLSLDVAQLIERQIWGQGFPQPMFCDTFTVQNQRVVGERHLKLKLMKDGHSYQAMRFGSLDPLPARARSAYRLTVNEFNGLQSVQLNIEQVEA